MLHIGICDDDTLFLSKAKTALEQYSKKDSLEIQIHSFKDPEELDTFINTKKFPLNILFLDIVLESQNGILIGKKINQKLPGCQIIFVTNHSEYAMDVYETIHAGYIIKSEFEKRLKRTFELLFEQKKLLTLPWKGKSITYHLADICYIERGRRTCKIVTIHDTSSTGQILNYSFNTICGQIESRQFVRCHNSYLVNLNEVRIYSADSFTMNNGEIISISRRYQSSVRDHFMEWQKGWI